MKRVAVVIPCYKCKDFVGKVVKEVPSEVEKIYVIDDACPVKSYEAALSIADSRVHVIHLERNLGVGGAVMAGYLAAAREGFDVIVKIDGDGQMNPKLLGQFARPIINEEADYTKGNRFYFLEDLQSMPGIRLFGNAVLSFLSKLSTGYWNVFDPTNGYTAISGQIVQYLPVGRISKRYFFESDLLFRLNILRATVIDIPMQSVYGDEKSNLQEVKVLPEFLYKHFRNFLKRIFYSYFLRNFSLASLELVVGLGLIIFGLSFGGYNWYSSLLAGVATPVGTIMIATTTLLVGIQLTLNFFSFDMNSVPNRAISKFLVKRH